MVYGGEIVYLMVLYQSKRSARRSQDEWCGLWHIGTHLFREYNHIVAQMLITGLDFSNEESHKNFQSTLNRLLELNVIPIINENDTIATQEISVGDNDTMGAIVAENANADLLIK